MREGNSLKTIGWFQKWNQTLQVTLVFVFFDLKFFGETPLDSIFNNSHVIERSGYQVIQAVTLLPPSLRSPTTFERVTFSPQKGHKELPAPRIQVQTPLLEGANILRGVRFFFSSFPTRFLSKEISLAKGRVGCGASQSTRSSGQVVVVCYAVFFQDDFLFGWWFQTLFYFQP